MARVSITAAVTARLNERGGLNVYSPIVHGHHLPHPAHLAKSDSFWRPFNEDEIRRSDELWVLALGGWERSVGVSREIEYAQALGMPVWIIDHETLAPQTANTAASFTA